VLLEEVPMIKSNKYNLAIMLPILQDLQLHNNQTIATTIQPVSVEPIMEEHKLLLDSHKELDNSH
jgi:hypothetical protein